MKGYHADKSESLFFSKQIVKLVFHFENSKHLKINDEEILKVLKNFFNKRPFKFIEYLRRFSKETVD